MLYCGDAGNPTGQDYETEIIADLVQNHLEDLFNCVIAGYSYGATIILGLIKRGISFRGAMLINSPYNRKHINLSLRILNKFGLRRLQPQVITASIPYNENIKIATNGALAWHNFFAQSLFFIILLS